MLHAVLLNCSPYLLALLRILTAWDELVWCVISTTVRRTYGVFILVLKRKADTEHKLRHRAVADPGFAMGGTWRARGERA